MTTGELISYIKKQIENNLSKDLIISKLIGAGWRREDIDEGFLALLPKPEPKIETPIEQSPKIEISISKIPEISELEIEAPKKENIEIPKDEVIIKAPIVEIPKIEEIKKETPKVWIPMGVPVTKNTEIQNEKIEIKEQVAEKYKEPIEEIKNKEQIINKEELIPTLIPKTINTTSFPSENNLPEVKKEGNMFSSNSLSSNLPQSAMLASYQKDLLSVQKVEEVNIKIKKTKAIKWIIIAIIILSIAGIVLLFIGGYFNFKNINIPFVKKDPKILLLNNSKILTSLKSYKTETNIEITSPSFLSISTGLITGEAVPFSEKDSISINTLGVIDQNDGKLFSDNFFTFKSSMLENPITTDVKNNGSDLFISIPDLSQIIKENSPTQTMLKINEKDFNLFPPLFSSNIEMWMSKINLYKLLSSGMSSYINSDTLGVYDEFINNVEITEKDQENIKGIDTYHYSIVPDRQFSKKLLTKISENFILNLSDDDNTKLSEIIGSTTIDSFDVWVGKGDSNIYQYSVIVDIPLSKIIGFEDKSIGDNKVNISWKTTYFDFNISNNVPIPEQFTEVNDFVNSIKELKIKNDVNSFKQLATNLSNVEKGFGSKSNLGGSCMKPNQGSLFSPLGHTKTATASVSSISELLNKVMNTTNGAGYCYSNTKAWSFTVPVSDNYEIIQNENNNYKYYYCIDDTGITKELITPPTGVVCK
jgi:hypothetical protein